VVRFHNEGNFADQNEGKESREVCYMNKVTYSIGCTLLMSAAKRNGLTNRGLPKAKCEENIGKATFYRTLLTPLPKK